MNCVFFTQRVEIQEGYGERRDCADQRWAELLFACGFLPIPVPNQAGLVPALLEALKPVGIVLTGGNDLAAYGGDAPERDQTEARLLEYAAAHHVPVLGVCRGMQMIHDYFGGRLESVQNHVRVKHSLQFEGKQQTVNSYHNLGIRKAGAAFRADALAEDGVIEAMTHKHLPIRAIMWHPEREQPFTMQDKELICKLMGGERQ